MLEEGVQGEVPQDQGRVDLPQLLRALRRIPAALARAAAALWLGVLRWQQSAEQSCNRVLCGPCVSCGCGHKGTTRRERARDGRQPSAKGARGSRSRRLSSGWAVGGPGARTGRRAQIRE